jgi:hypothetical protein
VWKPGYNFKFKRAAEILKTVLETRLQDLSSNVKDKIMA